VTRTPRRWGRISPQRRTSHQFQDRHHPPHPGHGPGTDRVLGPTPDPAPTAGLAMGNGVEHPVQQPVSPTPTDPRLTWTLPPPLDTKDPEEQADTQVGPRLTPTRRHTSDQGTQSKSTSDRQPIGGSRLNQSRASTPWSSVAKSLRASNSTAFECIEWSSDPAQSNPPTRRPVDMTERATRHKVIERLTSNL